MRKKRGAVMLLRTKVRRAIGAVAVAGAGMVMVAYALPGSAADSGSTLAHVTVGSTITLSDLTPSFTITGNPGATVSLLEGVSMVVTTNNPSGYAVDVMTVDEFMVPADPVANTAHIPITALAVRESGTSPYTSMSANTPVTVHTQATPAAPAGDTILNDFEILIPFITPGTYTATLTYTATTNP